MFGLFDRGARRAKRLRERGVPTRAVVADAQPAGEPGRWRVALLVEPAGRNSFVAHVETESPSGRPRRGGEAQVLHEPGGGEDVLLLAALPVEDAPAPPGTALDPTALGALAGDAAEGAVTHTSITVNGVPVDPAAGTATGYAGLSRDELRELVHTDPAGMAREIMRRLGTGELTPTHVEVAEPVTLTGDAADAMLQSLLAKGLLTPDQMEEIRRRRPGG